MLSVVIPIYNEEEVIPLLYERVKKMLDSIATETEVILVNDGSNARTFNALKQCNTLDKRFKVITLSRNFGHQAAYTAGLHLAKGEFIAMMDGDLQDPPELIIDMYELMQRKNLDVVYGKRAERSEKFPKKLFIGVFHSLFKRVTNLENIKQVGNFSIMSRKALSAFISLHEKNRYLPALRSFIGFSQGAVEYTRPDRDSGKAKMSTKKLMSLAFDAIFSFSSVPVKVCLYSGACGILLIFFAVVYTLVGKITGLAPLGWSSIIMSIYFIGSVQLLSIGILGEYVFRIYKETQNRPVYFIDNIVE